MNKRCLIIDDDLNDQKVLIKYIEEIKDFKLVDTCNNALEAISILGKEQIDIIFLDLNLPKVSGIDFLKNLKNAPIIVITTSQKEYAAECYDYDVVDYLLKPIHFLRFLKSIQKVNKVSNLGNKTPVYDLKGSNSHIFIKVNKKLVKVNYEDILLVESLKDYVLVKTLYEDLITHYNLQSFTALLPKDNFLRVHRSFTIAKDKINAINGNTIEIGSHQIPIGRNYKQEVKLKILGIDS